MMGMLQYNQYKRKNVKNARTTEYRRIRVNEMKERYNPLEITV